MHSVIKNVTTELEPFQRIARSSRTWSVTTVGKKDTNRPTAPSTNGDEVRAMGLRMGGVAVAQVADPIWLRKEAKVTFLAGQDIGLQSIYIQRNNRGPASIVGDIHKKGGIIGSNRQTL